MGIVSTDPVDKVEFSKLLVSAGGASGATQVTRQQLLNLKRAGTLVAGRTYSTPEGYHYYANSTTNFWPRAGTPILTGPLTTILGDSFMANAVVNTNRQSTLSTVGWAGTWMTVVPEVIAYRAVAGQSWDNVISAQIPGTLTDNSEIAWIGCGRNVYLNVTASSTIEYAIQRMKAALDILSPAKLLVICDSCTSVADSFADRSFEVTLLNEQMAALCAQYPNVVYNDIYNAMLDPASAVGNPLAAKTYDGVLHPGMRGAMAIGRQSAINLASRVIIQPRFTATALTGGPNFTGTGGTKTAGSGSITGNVPDGMRVWVSSGQAAVTLTNKTTGGGQAGSRLGVVITNPAAVVTRVDVDLNNTTAFNAQVTTGDTIRSWIGLRISNVAQLTQFYGTMSVNAGAVTTFCFSPNTSPDPTPNVEFPYVCRLMMPPQTLAAPLTALNVTLALQFAASTSAAATFDVWDYGVEKLVAV